MTFQLIYVGFFLVITIYYIINVSIPGFKSNNDLSLFKKIFRYVLIPFAMILILIEKTIAMIC